MRYLSLFSGIEAATVAWHPLGWECVAVSEIEPFPCALLAHHYPTVPNLGDVTKITERDIQALGQIDLVVFGSPCQDLSVAGKRRGFEGERSGLFFTAINIIEWARKHCGCRWALWENVPGAFTSNNGGDFAAVVGLLAGLDDPTVPPKGWGTEGCAVGTEGLVEWAVLDAQWFGVAQRRRRVFALADFGDWTGRPPILLEPEGLRGDFAPRRETGQVVASLTRNGVGASGADVSDAQSGHIRPVVASKQWPADVACTLDAAFGKKQGLEDQHVNSGCPLFVPAYGIPGNWIGRAPENGGNATEPMHEVAPCQTVADRRAVAYGFQPRIGRNGRGDMGDLVSALTAQAGQTGKGDSAPCVAIHENTRGELNETDVNPTLSTGGGKPGQGYAAIRQEMQVRRLTPIECERLQGFPDNYTLVPVKGKPAADGPRYKALGNSMAVPVMRWIGQGIDAVALFQ